MTVVEVGNTTLQRQVLLRMVVVANELIAAGGAGSILLFGLAAMAALGLVLAFFLVDMPQDQFCSAL